MIITRRCATAEDVISWGPCTDYPPERVRRIWGEKPLTALQALDLPIPPEDRLWAVLRTQMIPGWVLHGLMLDFAERALPEWERFAIREARHLLTVPRWALALQRQRGPVGIIPENKSATIEVKLVDACDTALIATSVESIDAETAAWAARVAFPGNYKSIDDVASYAAETDPEVERPWQVERVREVLQEGAAA